MFVWHGQCNNRPTTAFPAYAGTKLYCMVTSGPCVWTICPGSLHEQRDNTADSSRTGDLVIASPATKPHNWHKNWG